jgi:hypothetical protein
MRRKSHICCFGGAGLITLFFFFIIQEISFAGVAVSPLQQTVEVKPGKKTTFSINLTNNKRDSKTLPCPVKVTVLDFEVSDRGQLFFGPEYKHPRSAVSWITLDANAFVLQPGQSREVKGTVTASIDADGDYWAAAMIELGETQKNEKGVQVKLRTASGIFIHVTRRSYSERGNITDVNITMPDFTAIRDSNEQNLSGADLYKFQEKRSLKVETKVKNEGIVGFSARGKAYIYSDDWRRIATIPLDASRRQVLPDDNRWFTGIMAPPLPAGNYKLRTIFAYDSTYKHKITKDTEFTISQEMANVWAKNYKDEGTSKLKFEPKQFDLKLSPGRLTAATLQIVNQGINTVVADYKIESDGAKKDWLEMKATDFTIAPNGEHSTSCVIKVPTDAKPGTYKWTIFVKTEQSGLTGQEQNNNKQYKIPVSIVVDDKTSVVMSK